MARLAELSRIDAELGGAKANYIRVARQRRLLEADKRALGATLQLAARLNHVLAAQVSLTRLLSFW